VSDSEFLSFENAIDKLELAEDDLKRLISAGEIRAFREGSKMRLRAEDVVRVAQDLGLGGDIEEVDAGEVLEVEEVVFSDDSSEDAGMVTTQLSEEDTLLDDDLEVVEVEEEHGIIEEASTPAPSARARVAARNAGGAVGAADAETESKGTLVALVGTAVVMLWGLAFVIAMLSSASNGITDGIVEMFAG
jgi:hypothetical protein